MARGTGASRRVRARAAERRAEALALMLAGKTYDQIAAQLGFADRSGAYRAVQDALAEAAKRHDEIAARARPIAVERLERLWALHFERALEGDAKSTELCLRMWDRFVKINGIEAPLKIEATVTSRSELDAEIEVLLGRLHAPAASPPAADDDERPAPKDWVRFEPAP